MPYYAWSVCRCTPNPIWCGTFYSSHRSAIPFNLFAALNSIRNGIQNSDCLPLDSEPVALVINWLSLNLITTFKIDTFCTMWQLHALQMHTSYFTLLHWKHSTALCYTLFKSCSLLTCYFGYQYCITWIDRDAINNWFLCCVYYCVTQVVWTIKQVYIFW